MRKDSGLEITDRINVAVSPSERVVNAVNEYSEYIKSQVLADSIEVNENAGPEMELGTSKVNILINKN